MIVRGWRGICSQLRKDISNDISVLRFVWSTNQQRPKTVRSSHDKPLFETHVHSDPSNSFNFSQIFDLQCLFTSRKAQLICPYGPRSRSTYSLNHHTCIKSWHVSRQIVHKLMIVTEDMLQMLKGTRSCHLSYLQKAEDSSVACCEITYLPLGSRTSPTTSKATSTKELWSELTATV